MTNKKVGNDFEQDVCDILAEHGFWCHLLNANKAGQPADIIAVKNGKAYLIDAKVCTNGSFPLSRVEENQDLAMALWRERGNGMGWFALELDDKVYMVCHYVIKAYKNTNRKSLSAQDIFDIGIPLEKWVKKCK
jgi:Holliday junction resolvase